VGGQAGDVGCWRAFNVGNDQSNAPPVTPRLRVRGIGALLVVGHPATTPLIQKIKAQPVFGYRPAPRGRVVK